MHKAFDPEFVDSVIRSAVKKHFPEIKTIDSITPVKHKQRVGIHNSTFINSFIVQGEASAGTQITKEIVYSAHTDNSRLVAYNNLLLFSKFGFSSGTFQVVRPLEYHEDVHALLYEGAPGRTFMHYLAEKTPPGKLEHILKLIAQWVHTFHYTKLPPGVFSSIPIFNPHNLYHEAPDIVKAITEDNTFQGEKAKKFFDAYTAFEEKLRTAYTPRLTYGDLHPENIIIRDLSQKKLIIVDLTDVTVGDELRDIGTFIQQLSFMSRDYYTPDELSSLTTTFIEAYFKIPFSELSANAFQRINMYQAWTAVRSFVYFFYNEEKKPDAYGLLEDAWLYLALAQKGSREFTITHIAY